MREIEVKAILNDINQFLKLADKLGIKFGEEILQEDSTFESKTPKDDPTWNIFRLRKQNTKLILTMKHKASTRSRDNYEYESVVENEVDIVKMLKRLGYEPSVTINKARRIAKHAGLELCLDKIDGLGTFVEVEKLADDNADVDEIQKELWNLLISLGIKPEDRTHSGYDTLVKKITSSQS